MKTKHENENKLIELLTRYKVDHSHCVNDYFVSWPLIFQVIDEFLI